MNRPIHIDSKQTKGSAVSGTAEQQARAVRGAVGWLLGPELIGQLNKVLRKRSDPRDWMPYYRGSAHDECWKRDGSLTRVSSDGGPLEVSFTETAPTPRGRRGAERLTQVAEPTEAQAARASTDVWFDYLSDAGDAVDSMYAVAYATMVSFDGDVAPTTWSGAPQSRSLSVTQAGASAKLPRGQFVFFGGDTAYHVSDAATLRVRVQEPFDWAFADAQANGHVSGRARADLRTRRIYGIPGNHDWYDNIEGFSLVFRLGSTSANADDQAGQPIALPELERVQLASYVAIQLPFGWQLWGLDIDGGLDGRQQAYFESLTPERLILATPSPAIAFGAKIATKEHLDAAQKLKLPLPTLPIRAGSQTTPRYRLDLSGDIHHYARYYPRAAGDTYGSVVSGLGGAFHHPSFTRASSSAERIEPVREYPTSAESRDRIADNLLVWTSSWFGSWVRVVPFSLTLLLAFVGIYSQGGAWLLLQLWALVPGFSVQPPAGGAVQHGISWLLVGTLLVAGLGLRWAIRFGARVYDKQLADPSLMQNIFDLWKSRRFLPFFAPYRSYMYAWVGGLAALGPLLLAPLWLQHLQVMAHSSAPPSPFLDLETLLIVLGLPLAGAIAGWKVAAHYLATPMKWLLAGVGLVHGLAQVITCVVLAQLLRWDGATVVATLAAVVVAPAALYLARPLYKHPSRLATIALAALSLVVFLLVMLPIVYLAHGQIARELADPWWLNLPRFLGAPLCAMPLGTTWFVWYMAVASRLNAHNNEAGGTARVTEFRQFIRFHLREDGLTGYVIAIHNPRDELAARSGGRNLQFSLVDVFTLPTPSLRA